MPIELELDPTEQVPPVERLCRYLSQRSPQPMVAVDGLTHVVIYVNGAFARLVRRDREDLIGRPFAEAVPEGSENGCLALLDRVFRTGIPEILAEQEHRHDYPSPVYWSYSVWAILDEVELPAGVMIQVTEATETSLFRQQSVAMNQALLVSATRQHELAAETEVLTARLHASVATRDHFLAVLSHELRTPLASMSTGLEFLKLGGGRDPVAAENSRAMMERQLKLMVRLVDDLLDISRIANGKLELHKERVDLAAVLWAGVEASRPLIDRLGHELTVTPPAEHILLDADAGRLTQVFLNLLNNAAKYSEAGGHIWLSARREGNEAVVSVRDNGIGIPAADLPKVFDMFVQVDMSWKRAQGGLGIGLSLVKEFVGLHGGRVEILSDGAGRGSEFIVRLPLPGDVVAVSVPAIEIDHSNGSRRRILVVDDNRDAADSLAMMLELMGHKVRTAYDGVAGVAMAAKFRPEIILMDLGMPRMNGYDAARHIRAQPWGAAPFLVALTGWGADEDRKRTREAGFDRHLVKPVQPNALTKLIAELPIELS